MISKRGMLTGLVAVLAAPAIAPIVAALPTPSRGAWIVRAATDSGRVVDWISEKYELVEVLTILKHHKWNVQSITWELGS
jgi:hypothetical protein